MRHSEPLRPYAFGCLPSSPVLQSGVRWVVSERRTSWRAPGTRADEAASRGARQPPYPRPGSSGRSSIPASVLRQIERSAEYQVLLARLLELSEQLQSTLSQSQRALWLRLEDALFDYSQLLAEFHYAAGRRESKRPAPAPDESE